MVEREDADERFDLVASSMFKIARAIDGENMIATTANIDKDLTSLDGTWV
jgi:hypothetical protein